MTKANDNRGTEALPTLSGNTAGGTSSFRRVALGRLEPQVETAADLRALRQRLAVLLLAGDVATVSVAALLSPMLDNAASAGPHGIVAFLVCLAACTLGLVLAGAYRWEAVARSNHLWQVALGSMLGAAAGLLAFKLIIALPQGAEPVARITLRTALAPLVFALWGMGTRLVARAIIRRWEGACTLIAIGSSEQTRQVHELLARNRLPDTLVELDDADAGAAGRLEDLLRGRIRAIVLVRPRGELGVSLRMALVHARLAGLRVIGFPDLVEEFEERVPMEAVDSWWMIELDSLPAAGNATYLMAKRWCDLILTVPAFLVLLPFLVLVGIIVRLTSPGPALFCQQREGLRRRPFTIYKFRSMRTDAEKAGAQWASSNDPRVTSIGAFLRKSRIDELPQLWNVIRGDMSLIGPRPERLEFNQMLSTRIPWYDLRHLAKPGLSGWAQVRYPYGASIEDALAKLEFDVYYLRHASPSFDFRILLRTIGVVFGLRGR